MGMIPIPVPIPRKNGIITPLVNSPVGSSPLVEQLRPSQGPPDRPDDVRDGRLLDGGALRRLAGRARQQCRRLGVLLPEREFNRIEVKLLSSSK